MEITPEFASRFFTQELQQLRDSAMGLQLKIELQEHGLSTLGDDQAMIRLQVASDIQAMKAQLAYLGVLIDEAEARKKKIMDAVKA